MHNTNIPKVKVISGSIHLPDIKIIKSDPYSLSTKLERIFTPSSRGMYNSEEEVATIRSKFLDFLNSKIPIKSKTAADAELPPPPTR